MARRRKSWFRKVVVLSVLVLAGIGAYTLYDSHRDDVNAGVDKVEKVGKKVKRAAKAGYEELK